MQRYYLESDGSEGCYAEMKEDEIAGDYVLYSDHQQQIAELESALKVSRIGEDNLANTIEELVELLEKAESELGCCDPYHPLLEPLQKAINKHKGERK